MLNNKQNIFKIEKSLCYTIFFARKKHLIRKFIYLCSWTFSTSVCRCALQRVQLLKRAFDILSLTEIWKISIIEDMRQYTHAWDYCTLRFKGIIYLTAWAIVYYSMMGIPEPLLDSIQ